MPGSMEHILGKVSYHAVYDASIEEALDFAAANGFAGVQVAVEAPHLSFERVSDERAAAIAERCAAEGLRVTLHAPDNAVSLFTASGYLVEGVCRYLHRLFDFAEKVRSPLITFHVGSPATFPTAPRPGEPFPAVDRPAHERTLVRHLDAGEIALCWDLAKGREDGQIEEFMWANLARVRQVHLHDVAAGKSHEVVGAGELDFMAYLPRLAEADVLDYCIEVRPREKALESLAHLRRLIAGASG